VIPPTRSQASSSPTGGRGPVAALLRWLPLALACGVLVHLWVLGMEPALQERARLEAARLELAGEHQQLVGLHTELERTRAALEDPHYQERRERWRLERRLQRAVHDPAEAPNPARPEPTERAPSSAAEVAAVPAEVAGPAPAGPPVPHAVEHSRVR
jgi:hypothetical protein